MIVTYEDKLNPIDIQGPNLKYGNEHVNSIESIQLSSF